ncbi:glycoside hydrolase family 28 protein [Hymenobacter caeli]|uniref:Polygalacturonase n=1 Tax=Hymenobacter caeli TaxID=2735894 RepID=A0ABX2FJS2_9BACT|nr:right-handed parallel beta-helix repeat-containing protein [Hymenobacter caeli]NRT17365.1 polygalacturonase [Hymenobacter caeli]
MLSQLIRPLALLVLFLPGLARAQGPAATKTTVYNIRAYGALGNGKALDSRAINAAIEAAALAGGGQVYLPAGDYLSGAIRLKSNISLYLEQGATIIATADDPAAAYDPAEPSANTTYQDSGHSHWHDGLIWGENLHDISILGPGKIWGKGLLKDYAKDAKLANKAISLLRCRNVIIRDVTLQHGGWFAILATGVDNLTIDNLKIDTNRDGMDIDCCRNVRVSNCLVNSPYDDGICLKSSFGLGEARATENVTITNCQVSGYDEGTLLDGTFRRTSNPEYKLHPTGRIKFGTESNGGFKNIAIANCVFDYCRGLALETVDGGLLEDVSISNLTMRDVTNSPIFLYLGARLRGPAGTPVGQLRRVSISNVVVYNADPDFACIVTGVPGHPVEDVRLRNIRIYYRGGGTAEQAARAVPEAEKKYPEPSMLGPAPAYGFYIRHAKDVQLSDVEVSYLSPEARPAFVADDVQGLTLRNLTAQKATGGQVLALKNVTGFELRQSLGLPDAKLPKTVQKTW